MDISADEEKLRLFLYFTTLTLVLCAELCVPRRKRTAPKLQRWGVNLALVASYTLFIRLCVPLLAVGVAALAETKGWGLWHLFYFPAWFEVIVSVLFLDFLIYLQHVLFHKVPLLWRLHMVHHSDVDLDVTSGVRFHPLEIILSLAIKCFFIVLMGAPVLAVFIFEAVLSTSALFNHGNFYIPEKADRILRTFLVTPDMHRIHHSVIRKETDSNYGFNISWWDKLCGTYKEFPSEGQLRMKIGVPEYRNPAALGFLKVLELPFTYKPGQTSSEMNEDV